MQTITDKKAKNYEIRPTFHSYNEKCHEL